MSAPFASENEEIIGDFNAETIDITFMDEDDLPINNLAINYLERVSDNEVESDFLESESDESESDESSEEEAIEKPQPKRRKRGSRGANTVNNAESVWKEDITLHADLNFTQYVGPKVRLTGNESPLNVFEMFFTDEVFELITFQTNL